MAYSNVETRNAIPIGIPTDSGYPMSLIPCFDISGLSNPTVNEKSKKATIKPLSILPVQSIPFEVGAAGASDDMSFSLSTVDWALSKT
jgi:hypothetical protein